MLKQILLASTVAIMLTACAESHTPSTPHAPSAPQPFPAIYNPEVQPHHLSLTQFHEIESRATTAHPGHIWFVYIADNDGTNYRATVYFVPTSHNLRVYHGQSANFLSATRDEVDFMQKTGMSTVAIDSYTYVTDHPAVDATVPPPTEITFPFPTPEQIPDAELPKILDAARTVFAPHPNTPTSPLLPIMAHPSSPMPVRSIPPVIPPGSGSHIEVIFGWWPGYSATHSLIVTLERDGDDFIVIASDWIS